MLLGFLGNRTNYEPIKFLKADDGTLGGGSTSGDESGDDSDDSDSDGEEDDETDDDDDEESDAEEKLPDSAASSFKRLLERHGGNARRLAAKLFDENWSYRQQNKLLSGELTQLRGRTPKNSRVVSKNDFEELRAFRALGKATDVKARLDTAKTVSTELATRRKDDTLRKVSEVTGYALPVLKDIGGSLDYEFDEVEEEGEKYERALVVIKNGDQVEKKDVLKYADEKWSHFIPALSADGETQTSRSGGGTNGTGRRIVKQPAANNGATTRRSDAKTGVASGYMSNRYAEKKSS